MAYVFDGALSVGCLDWQMLCKIRRLRLYCAVAVCIESTSEPTVSGISLFEVFHSFLQLPIRIDPLWVMHKIQ